MGEDEGLFDGDSVIGMVGVFVGFLVGAPGIVGSFVGTMEG